MKKMKKYIYKWLIPVLLFALVLASCDKYLDIQPKGVRLLETVTDYDRWLNSNVLETSIPGEIVLLEDYIDILDIPSPIVSSDDRVYTWHKEFSENVTAAPVIWEQHYKTIYYFNSVIQGIDEATGGTEEEKKSLKAEALLGRAFEYLYLVNLYGKVYDANTANQDLAVPFVISNDLEDDTPARSTVQYIYNHIITDIETAIPDLPVENTQNRYRGSVAAAYSVLARTYLYMRDYTKAAQNAQLALDNEPNPIVDFNTISTRTSHIATRTDAIYAKHCGNLRSERPALNFLQSFDPSDLRLPFYYRNLGDYSFTERGDTYFFPETNTVADLNCGPTVAEMRLILAEAAAHRNELETACDELDHVRKCRFPTTTYVKYESDVQEEVLQKVLDERTFEFAYTGLRWFDMRRLDAEGRMPDVYRYDGENNVIATLPAGSNKYTLQIPIQVLYFNPGWPQNPWDED